MSLNILKTIEFSNGEACRDWIPTGSSDVWAYSELPAADASDVILNQNVGDSGAGWDVSCEDGMRSLPQDDPLLFILPQNSQVELSTDGGELYGCWGILCEPPDLMAEESAEVKSKVKPPDISNGLGRSQSKKDIVKLERHIVNRARFMVYGGTLCTYREPCWRKLCKEEANTAIRAILEQEGLGDCLTHQDFEKIRKNLSINPKLQVEGEVEPSEDKLNLLDGTYDLRRQCLCAHDPDDFFFHVIRCCGRGMERCTGEVFEAFVEQLSDGDPNVRRQLLELTALVIMGKQVKYFYVLLGESHTGKSQFGRFLEELVGREHVQSVRGVHDFADRWAVGMLEGKLLATCLDIPDTPLPKEAVGTIKQFVGDDPVKGERKWADPFTFYRKPMLLFAGNHPIRLPNLAQEQALLNRMVVIPFRNPVTEQEMVQSLYKKLLEEAPYIVWQAIQAYEELAANNFEVTRSEIPPEYVPQESRVEVQQAINFLEQYCCMELGVETATSDIYERYSQVVGLGDRLSFINFSRVLSSFVQKQELVATAKRVNGIARRGYRGLRLRDPV